MNESGQDQSFGLDVTYEDEVWRHKSNLKTGWINTLVQWILAHVKSEDSEEVDLRVIEAQEEVMGLFYY